METVKIKEASERLNVKPPRILQLLQEGRLRGKKVPGEFFEYWLVDAASIAEYQASKRAYKKAQKKS